MEPTTEARNAVCGHTKTSKMWYCVSKPHPGTPGAHYMVHEHRLLPIERERLIAAGVLDPKKPVLDPAALQLFADSLNIGADEMGHLTIGCNYLGCHEVFSDTAAEPRDGWHLDALTHLVSAHPDKAPRIVR